MWQAISALLRFDLAVVDEERWRAVFGGGYIGDEARRGTETQQGRRGGLAQDGIGVVAGDMDAVDEAHGAVDEDAAGLVIEVSGEEALDLAEGLRISGHLVVEEDGFLGVEVGSLGGARWAGGALQTAHISTPPPPKVTPVEKCSNAKPSFNF